MASKTTSIKKKNSKKSSIGALIGSIIILVIVVISFVVGPAISDMANATVGDIVMGSYGDEEITYSFVKDTPFKREIASLTSSSTDSSDLRLLMQAYGSAVTKAAAIDEINANGYKVSKKELDDAVMNSGYYNVDGVFSAEVFKNTPEIKKAEIREAIERELKLEKWREVVLYSQRRSKKSLEFIYSMAQKNRNFEYVTYNYSEYPEDLLKEYGNNNSDSFKELFLKRITLNEESLADDIIRRVEAGDSTFEDEAKAHSLDNFKDNGGEMSSPLMASEVETVFGITDNSSLVSMKVGDTPIKIELDGQFILLTPVKEVVEPDFDNNETLNKVRNYMLTNERGIVEDYFINKLKSVKSLEDMDKAINETGNFSINYGGEQLLPGSVNRANSNPIFNQAIANENFYETLFSLEADVVSEPIVLGDSVSIFKLKEEITDAMDNYFPEDQREGVISTINRYMLNYKSVVEEKRFTNSPKYTNNFIDGYKQITDILQGN